MGGRQQLQDARPTGVVYDLPGRSRCASIASIAHLDAVGDLQERKSVCRKIPPTDNPRKPDIIGATFIHRMIIALSALFNKHARTALSDGRVSKRMLQFLIAVLLLAPVICRQVNFPHLLVSTHRPSHAAAPARLTVLVVKQARGCRLPRTGKFAAI